MNELVLELTEISPREFFGQQNEHIDLLKKYFPKLKIVARGNKIKAYGDEDLLEEFDKRFDMLTAHFVKYNKLDENAIERVLSSNGSSDYQSSENSGEKTRETTTIFTSCFHVAARKNRATAWQVCYAPKVNIRQVLSCFFDWLALIVKR